MKKFLICFLIIVLSLSIFAPLTFAETDVSKIQSDGGVYNPRIIDGYVVYQSPVIITLDSSGHIVDRTFGSTGTIVYYEDVVETVEKAAAANDTNNTTADTPKEISNELAEQIFKLTNEERKKAGLDELSYNYDLQSGADTRAQEASVSFSHTRPNGETCYTVFNVNYNVAGENLIKADSPIATAENLMASWMDSPGHRENILLPEFTSIAIGIYVKDDVVYASQLFVG